MAESDSLMREVAEINRSVLAARKSLRPSNLGALREDGTPKRPEFQVGQQAPLAAINAGLKRLTDLGVRNTGSDYSSRDSEAEKLMASLRNQRRQLENNRNEVLSVTSRDRSSQREAIQANVGILSGRTQPSSARVPRLNRGAGLLMPFSSMERLI